MSLSLLAGASAAYSQGTINWTDYISPAGANPGFTITIWLGGSETPGGGGSPNNTSADLPAGTATYTGTALPTSGYEVGLYVDTTATLVSGDVASGAPVATSGLAGAGYWTANASLTATTAFPAGSLVFTELAAWSTADGATSYAMAVSEGVANGLSGPSSGTTALGGGSPPATPGTLEGSGLQDFIVSTVPEPSTIALGVIGASTFLMRLRRKQ